MSRVNVVAIRVNRSPMAMNASREKMRVAMRHMVATAPDRPMAGTIEKSLKVAHSANDHAEPMTTMMNAMKLCCIDSLSAVALSQNAVRLDRTAAGDDREGTAVTIAIAVAAAAVGIVGVAVAGWSSQNQLRDSSP
jgi:hypothetical protein